MCPATVHPESAPVPMSPLSRLKLELPRGMTGLTLGVLASADLDELLDV